MVSSGIFVTGWEHSRSNNPPPDLALFDLKLSEFTVRKAAVVAIRRAKVMCG